MASIQRVWKSFGVSFVQLLLLMMIMAALDLSSATATEPDLKLKKPFIVSGEVYCDTCRCGFETNASTPIPGAIVRLECRERSKWVLVYSKESVTDSKGKYRVSVTEDHREESCKMVLVKSPISDCNEEDNGRNSATVILTNNNGLTNNIRFANSMGFLIKYPLAICPSVLKQYMEFDDSF